METRSKRRRLISVSSYVSQQTLDLPATFESLNDDTLTTTLEFVGNKSYVTYAGINKHCKEIYLTTKGMTKDTFLYGYAPLSVIKERYNRTSSRAQNALLSKGVLFYNRGDVLNWAIQDQNNNLLMVICNVAGKEGRIDLLNKMWYYIDDDWNKRYIFKFVDQSAAEKGKLNVLEWLVGVKLSIYKEACARQAAIYGHIHILQWLREKQGLKLGGVLYYGAIEGDQLHVMKWLREQGCPWDVMTFMKAAERGNLEVLQWLHDEGCPWTEYLRVDEQYLRPEVIDWLRLNGHGNRIVFRGH